MRHVGRGIGDLRLAQRRRAPIRRLLLFGNFPAQDLAHQIFEARADQYRSASGRDAILVQNTGSGITP